MYVNINIFIFFFSIVFVKKNATLVAFFVAKKEIFRRQTVSYNKTKYYFTYLYSPIT